MNRSFAELAKGAFRLLSIAGVAFAIPLIGYGLFRAPSLKEAASRADAALDLATSKAEKVKAVERQQEQFNDELLNLEKEMHAQEALLPARFSLAVSEDELTRNARSSGVTLTALTWNPEQSMDFIRSRRLSIEGTAPLERVAAFVSEAGTPRPQLRYLSGLEWKLREPSPTFAVTVEYFTRAENGEGADQSR